MNKITTAETMTLDGGNPSLDFVNSGYDREPGRSAERLHSYDDLLILSSRLGIIDQKMLETLRDEATHHPKRAAGALANAKIFRKAFYEILLIRASSLATEVDKQSLEIFNNYLKEALKHRKISMSEQKFISDWVIAEKDLDQPLRSLVLHAFELITGPKQFFIKQCSGCAWLFLDESKNHKRKWCDMQSCGNSAKVKRYYLKHHP